MHGSLRDCLEAELIYFHPPTALLLGTCASHSIVFNIFLTQEASIKPNTKHHPEHNITLLWYLSTNRTDK